MMLNIHIQVDTATPALREVERTFTGRADMHRATAHRLIRDTNHHVTRWGLSHPNKLGGRRTNYWSHIAAKINPADCLESVSDSAAVVALGGETMPGLMRAFGDVTIIPGTKTGGAKYIPIPARSEAYGLSPREIPGLVTFWIGAGKIGGLAEGIPTQRTRNTSKGAKGSTYLRPGAVMFWFKDQVVQPQDRSILPSDDEWSESVNEGAKDWLDAQLAKIKGGGK